MEKVDFVIVFAVDIKLKKLINRFECYNESKHTKQEETKVCTNTVLKFNSVILAAINKT